MAQPEPSSDGRPTVSLVLPIRNEEAHIAACFEGIREQTYPADLLELIVVDGESTDRTMAIVAKEAAGNSRVRLIPNPARTAPAGLNLGIEAATGEYVGVVSGHSVLSPDYVARALRASIATGAWSVGGTIVRRAESPMQRAIGLATSSRIGVGDSMHNYAARAGWVETVFPGFWRRELFDRVGQFDPAMIANEDNEFSLRIRKAGGRIWYDPEIRVEYVPRATLDGLFHQYRLYGLGKVRVLRKHGGGLGGATSYPRSGSLSSSSAASSVSWCSASRRFGLLAWPRTPPPSSSLGSGCSAATLPGGESCPPLRRFTSPTVSVPGRASRPGVLRRVGHDPAGCLVRALDEEGVARIGAQQCKVVDVASAVIERVSASIGVVEDRRVPSAPADHDPIVRVSPLPYESGRRQ